MLSLPRVDRSGRLLSEFLVGLALLFLALTANLALLRSAVRSSTEAAASERALELAREGLEQMIASPNPAAVTRGFGAGKGARIERTYHRRGWVIPLDDEEGLSRIAVEVEWSEAGASRRIRLERYVNHG